MLFHRHSFKEEVERFYAPPTDFDVEAKRVTPGSLEKLALGVTTIHFVCECGQHKFVEILGKELK